MGERIADIEFKAIVAGRSHSGRSSLWSGELNHEAPDEHKAALRGAAKAAKLMLESASEQP